MCICNYCCSNASVYVCVINLFKCLALLAMVYVHVSALLPLNNHACKIMLWQPVKPVLSFVMHTYVHMYIMMIDVAIVIKCLPKKTVTLFHSKRCFRACTLVSG